MGKITFIVGGARSGKSSYALKLAEKSKRVAFIATGLGFDKEMKERISIHKKIRPSHWETFEEPKRLSNILKKIHIKPQVVIIDCLTLLVSNLLLKGTSREKIEEEIKKAIKVLKSAKYKSIIVSNEVGLGIVPQSKLGRDFRDLAGKINQITAKESDDVFFMTSGLPLKIKGGKGEKNK